MKSPLLAWMARIGVTAIGGTFAILIAVQYARIIERNVAYVQQVHDVERDVTALDGKARQAASHDPALDATRRVPFRKFTTACTW